MRSKEWIIVSAVIIISLTAFLFWFFKDPVKDFSVNLPGQDNRPAKGSDTTEVVKIGENFTEYEKASSALTGKWTQFRGADFDNINKETIKLIR